MSAPGGGRRGGPARWYLEGDTWPEELAWGDLEPGRLEIAGDNLAGTNARRLGPFLERHGALVSHLSLESRYLGEEARIDLSAIDLVKHCPHVTRLWLQGFRVTTRVFALPQLTQLHLSDCTVVGASVPPLGDVPGGPGSRLEETAFFRCRFEASELTWGPHAGLRELECRGEAEAWPPTATFDGCRDLVKLTLDLDAAFKVCLRGSMPHLSSVRLHAGRGREAGLDHAALRDCSFDLIRTVHC